MDIPVQLILLCGFAFLAGFVDSVVGGGGLIQFPMLLLVFPETHVATLMGTNKLVAISGTAVAASQYARQVPIRWRLVAPSAALAFIGSALGAWVVSRLPSEDLRPVIIVLLIGVAIYTFWNKNFGAIARPETNQTRQIVIGCLAGAGIGFYDGFLGPGTGSFLIFTFIAALGLDFLQASASAKVVNVATNLAALIYFGLNGHIMLHIALPMAVFNILGAILGSRLAILKGSRFVRVFFLVVVSGIILKLVVDTFPGLLGR